MNKGTLLVAMFLILITPPALALNCNQLSGNEFDLCKTIETLNATKEEQEAILTTELYSERTMPNHQYVYLWNSRINPLVVPLGIQTQNQSTIKDAWLKILDLMPSVIENNTLLCDSKGTIHSAYNYRTELPTVYSPGDCKTEYYHYSDNARLDVFLNNILIGNQKLSNFTTTSEGELNFLANLEIESKTTVKHYRNNNYCCKKYPSGKCKKYCTDCKYSSTEIVTDRLLLTDNLSAKKEPYSPEYNLTLTNYYSGMLKGEVFAKNFTSLSLSFDNSSYKKSNFIFDYEYSFPPYDIITIKAIPRNQESISNLNIKPKKNNTFEFIVKASRLCSLGVFTHFSVLNYTCIPEYTPKNISIKAERLTYLENQTILVSISPSDLEVNLSYGNQSIIARNSTEFIAELYSNKIKAVYGEESTEEIISVTDGNHLILISELALVFSLSYILFSILTKQSWITKWLNAEYLT